jgi:hypothetical protein
VETFGAPDPAKGGEAFVNPVGAGRGLVGGGWQARLYEGFSQLLRLIIDPTQAPVWLISHISPKYFKGAD